MLKKLIDSKKITKKQLLQKLMSVTEKDENGSEIGESPAAENIMDAESEEDISLQRGKARESSHRN